MKTIEKVARLVSQITHWKSEGKTLGLVPTMGFFHAGHLALMQEAANHCDRTVVSIFVNPRQFGPEEDLAKYPRNFAGDERLAEETGVDLLFAPAVEEMYPERYQTTVSVHSLSKGLCGQSRPGHFDGVATVVAKLFNLVKPDIAVFGKKDYQQLALLRQMNADLNFGVKIIGHSIVREKDGLAMSSRNKYLDQEERQSALCLYRSLQHAIRRVAETKKMPAAILKSELQRIIEGERGFKIDYIAVVDQENLEAKEIAEHGDLLALAVYINNKVRLIDNTIL